MTPIEWNFSGKVAFVTGGGSGIGAACVRLLAAAGAEVFAGDLNLSGVEGLAAELGPTVRPLQLDVTNRENVGRAAGLVANAFGRMDIAINSAGCVGPIASLDESDPAAFLEVMAVNTTGLYYSMREELRLMRSAGDGVIVNIASLAGITGFANATAYCASKHAVVGMTKVAALENAAGGIRVNAVCPNLVKTPLLDEFVVSSGGAGATDEQIAAGIPMKRLGTTDEIASMCAWLCSDGAGFVTGQAIAACGGSTAGFGA